MAELSQKLLDWLHSVLLSQEYHDVNRTFSDVAQALSHHSTLRPQTNVHTFDNGHSALLLQLRGTIPVPFRGTIYSFPISIWVPQAYPREGPIAFVTPTREMAVRPGQHISGEGRVYHPYLANWRPDRSNLIEFLQILQDVFSREPPAVARQEVPVRRALIPENGGPPPLPPVPPKLEESFPGGQPSRTPPPSSGQPPPPPPKPSQNLGYQMSLDGAEAPPIPPHPSLSPDQRGTNSVSYRTDYAQSPQRYSVANSYMPQRQSSLRNEHYVAAQLDQKNQPPIVHEQRQRFHSTQQIDPNDSSRSSSQDLAPHQRYKQQPPRPLPGAVHPPYAAYSGQLQPQQIHHQPPNPNQQQPYRTYHQTPPAPKSPEDLLTSSSDPPLPVQTPTTTISAPPIPPNPQKDALLAALSRTLTQQLHSTISHNTSLIPPLLAQHAALQAALSALHQESTSLTALSTLLSSNEAILHKAMRDADKVIAEAKHRKVPSVDEVLVAPTVVGEQMYELVAQERACVEARAVLGRALDRGRVGVEGWVKGVRGLAREEFLKKVLVRKCARGMGLREGDEWEIGSAR